MGKRAKAPILHPKDGRVLIQENKIITRTLIMSLKDVDFDVRQVNVQE